MEDNSNKINLLITNIEKVIQGKRAQIEFVVATLLAAGHVLLEDNPGTGKTILARAIAGSIASSNSTASFKRIQFTPDLLPMDLLGSHIFDDAKKDFVFKKGPLFCNVLLADEINRASPKVQSALLECMAENQISIGESTYALDSLFFTIATQNPIEMEGTYPLPAAQLDRFFMKISLGYADATTEKFIFNHYQSIGNNLANIQAVLNKQEIINLQQEVHAIFIHQEIINSVSNIIEGTRNSLNVVLPASTRSGIAFIKCLKAYAMVLGRQFVIEDDLKKLAPLVLHHRLEFKNRDAKQTELNSLIDIEIERLAKLNLHNN
jgi:MoxR-like ATPase